MVNKLLENIDKLHTTKMGAERIKRNLGLTNHDPVQWCRLKILDQNTTIIKQGKNYYIHGCIITVNANSYTIITAHREKQKWAQVKNT